MPRVQRQLFCRPPMERMNRIHQLLRNRQYPNCSTLSREFEMCTRTIKRDVDFMRCRMDLPIEFDPQRNGYFYTREVTEFPQVPMTEAEIFALLVANKAIAQYHGTPFERPLEAAFRRLTGQLDQGVHLSLGSVEDALSFRPFAPEDADLKLFETLTRGLRDRRGLRFQYRNKGATRHALREVNPYHLACIENHWYLFGFDIRRQDMRTFALARMEAPVLARRRFTLPRKFDLNEYLRGSLSVFKGGDDYEVVADFDAWGADEIRGRRWHASQEVTELPGGALRLRLRLNSIEEAEKWILSMGTHATVVRPQALAERIARTGRILAERYGTERLTAR